MAQRLEAERLVLRGWEVDDAPAALGAYGDDEVARWLAPAIDQIRDVDAMGVALEQWIAEDARMLTPAGRWAGERREDGQVVGGATLLPLSPDEELEIGWALHRQAWGRGYGTESGRALARGAFDHSVELGIAAARRAAVRTSVGYAPGGGVWCGRDEAPPLQTIHQMREPGQRGVGHLGEFA